MAGEKAAREAALALRAQAGDKEACSELLLGYLPMMHRIAIGLEIEDPSLHAEDLVQECFETLARRKLRAFKPDIASFGTWVYMHIRSTINRAAFGVSKSERKRALDSAMHFSAAPLESMVEIDGTRPQPDFCLLVRVEDLVSVANLSMRQRQVLEMRADGSVLREIGEELGITRERVRQIEAVAIEKLRHIYDGCESLEDVGNRIVAVTGKQSVDTKEEDVQQTIGDSHVQK